MTATGSKITARMKEAGEDFAQDQLKQAKLEDNPRLLHPYEIGNFIETMEELVSKGKIGKPLKVDRTDSNEVSLVMAVLVASNLDDFSGD